MAVVTVWLNIDEERMVSALREASEKLDSAESEVILDLGSVHWIDSPALRAMEDFSRIADEKGVKVIARGVNVYVYKVLKLMNLASKFSFIESDGRSPARE
jgi:anti-anti-sigma regulatory factor